MRTINCFIIGNKTLNNYIILSYIKIQKNKGKKIFIDNSIDNKIKSIRVEFNKEFIEIKFTNENVDIIVLFFSILAPSTFDEIFDISSTIKNQYPSKPIILVGKDVDRRDNDIFLENLNKQGLKPISIEEGKKKSNQIGALEYIECSDENGFGIEHLFDRIIKNALYYENNVLPIFNNKLIYFIDNIIYNVKLSEYRYKFNSTQLDILENILRKNHPQDKNLNIPINMGPHTITFSLVTLNVLAQSYIFPKNIKQIPIYQYVKSEYLNENYRYSKLLKWMTLDYDFFCLQELEYTWFNLIQKYFEQNYGALYSQKKNGKSDGVAIFYKKKTVVCNSKIILVVDNRAPVVVGKFTIKKNNIERELIIATTHLTGDPNLDNVRKKEIESIFSRFSGFDNIPQILCGDFNLRPYSDLYNIISKKMNSTYKKIYNNEPDYTFRTDKIRSVVDYCWINLKVTPLKELSNINNLSSTYEKDGKFLPRDVWFSDHLPMAFDYKI